MNEAMVPQPGPTLPGSQGRIRTYGRRKIYPDGISCIRVRRGDDAYAAMNLGYELVYVGTIYAYVIATEPAEPRGDRKAPHG